MLLLLRRCLGAQMTTPTARRQAVYSVAWWAGERCTRRRAPPSCPTHECASNWRVWSRATTLACSPPSTAGSLPVRALPTARTHPIGRPTAVRAAPRSARTLGGSLRRCASCHGLPSLVRWATVLLLRPCLGAQMTTPTARRPAVYSVAWWAGERCTRRLAPPSIPIHELSCAGRVWSRATTLACSPPSTAGSLPVRAFRTARTHPIGRPTAVRAAPRAAHTLGGYLRRCASCHGLPPLVRWATVLLLRPCLGPRR
jgi:hypothetical protein